MKRRLTWPWVLIPGAVVFMCYFAYDSFEFPRGIVADMYHNVSGLIILAVCESGTRSPILLVHLPRDVGKIGAGEMIHKNTSTFGRYTSGSIVVSEEGDSIDIGLFDTSGNTCKYNGRFKLRQHP